MPVLCGSSVETPLTWKDEYPSASASSEGRDGTTTPTPTDPGSPSPSPSSPEAPTPPHLYTETPTPTANNLTLQNKETNSSNAVPTSEAPSYKAPLGPVVPPGLAPIHHAPPRGYTGRSLQEINLRALPPQLDLRHPLAPRQKAPPVMVARKVVALQPDRSTPRTPDSPPNPNPYSVDGGPRTSTPVPASRYYETHVPLREYDFHYGRKEEPENPKRPHSDSPMKERNSKRHSSMPSPTLDPNDPKYYTPQSPTPSCRNPQYTARSPSPTMQRPPESQPMSSQMSSFPPMAHFSETPQPPSVPRRSLVVRHNANHDNCNLLPESLYSPSSQGRTRDMDLESDDEFYFRHDTPMLSPHRPNTTQFQPPYTSSPGGGYPPDPQPRLPTQAPFHVNPHHLVPERLARTTHQDAFTLHQAEQGDHFPARQPPPHQREYTPPQASPRRPPLLQGAIPPRRERVELGPSEITHTRPQPPEHHRPAAPTQAPNANVAEPNNDPPRLAPDLATREPVNVYLETFANNVTTNGKGVTRTRKPPGGWPWRHVCRHVLANVDLTTLSAWGEHKETSVFAHLFRGKFELDFRATIDIIKSVIVGLTPIECVDKIGAIVPRPAFPPAKHEHFPAPYNTMITKLPPQVVTFLVNFIEVASLDIGTVIFSSGKDERSAYVFTMGGLQYHNSPSSAATVAQLVRDTLLAQPRFAEMINRNSNLPGDAVATVYASLMCNYHEVTLPKENGGLQRGWNVFIGETGLNLDQHSLLIQMMRNTTYETPDFGIGFPLTGPLQPSCSGCKSADHNAFNCPYPKIPGWKGWHPAAAAPSQTINAFDDLDTHAQPNARGRNKHTDYNNLGKHPNYNQVNGRNNRHYGRNDGNHNYRNNNDRGGHGHRN
ncbi:hypothetical protein DXG01_013678 [Tephrocybe rancida]|nr:hypothetical protein DXG01_013678 [Tephrocybe rancida]